MNMQQLMKQAQKMQEQMQKQMETTVVEASAGGGMVSVKMNGNKQLLSVTIDQEVFGGNDKEMLQDLVVAAVNEGILQLAALIDIKRRPASQIRGPKWLWATAVTVISSAGVLPISYFVVGRRQPRSQPD